MVGAICFKHIVEMSNPQDTLFGKRTSTLNKSFSYVYTKADMTRVLMCENHAVRSPCPRIQLSRICISGIVSTEPDEVSQTGQPIPKSAQIDCKHHCWPTSKDCSTFVRHRRCRPTGSIAPGQSNTYLQEGNPQGTWKMGTCSSV